MKLENEMQDLISKPVLCEVGCRTADCSTQVSAFSTGAARRCSCCIKTSSFSCDAFIRVFVRRDLRVSYTIGHSPCAVCARMLRQTSRRKYLHYIALQRTHDFRHVFAFSCNNAHYCDFVLIFSATFEVR